LLLIAQGRQPRSCPEGLGEVMPDTDAGWRTTVIKLFALAQIKAIVTGVECIKPMLLRKVFEDEFKPVHPMLAALRSGRPELIAKYDDLLMPEIEGRLLTLTRSLDRIAPSKPPEHSIDGKAKKFAALLEEMEIPQDIAISMADELLEKYPNIPVAALIHKATAYLAHDSPKKPIISRLKRTERGVYPKTICARVMPTGQKVRSMADLNRPA